MTDSRPVLTSIQRAWLQEIGIDARMLAHFSSQEFAETHSLEPSVSPARDVAATTAAPVTITPAPAADHPHAAPTATSLAALGEQVAGCAACPLHEVRSRTVFGEGVQQSPRWMFIGEAPGEFDESAGRPFQGRAGELLQAMLASIGLDASAPAYFANVLKCRPVNNRSPEPEEVAACLPHLRRQITLLQPGCLVALGRVSAAALLGHEGELDDLRGQVHQYVDEAGRSIPVVVTHHPAALLLHWQFKADAWRDLNLLRSLGAQGSPGAV
ncbi:uracil-DNA glycosylase family protein [Yanghanlia caeni]|uniref:Type-4 uracil-DNA glycosylase n=1 Tax=Yanghanlia caeni TaxID=3064283 RepID=A0ABU1D3P1_9BURK|nr:uracil-DNA glycosylase [Alcaligenaceae bacterium LG-2]NGR07564.1 uracil-DNA glycosylase [bacterium SGD-2]HZH57259.1 uracil-DNA glycosylase [Burkholderiaceae bacterium]